MVRRGPREATKKRQGAQGEGSMLKPLPHSDTFFSSVKGAVRPE